MWKDWFVAPARDYLFVALSFIGIYASIVVLTRLTGLRSFSKMSAPDFAMTVAVGSLFAGSISNASPPLPLAAFALLCLFVGQWGFAALRRQSRRASDWIDNSPVLLMDGSHFLEANMEATNITRADIVAKLREANVLRLDQVRAVVFETTGDISVLHASSSESDLDSELLDGVRRNGS